MIPGGTTGVEEDDDAADAGADKGGDRDSPPVKTNGIERGSNVVPAYVIINM
jgi:hypothetical protein